MASLKVECTDLQSDKFWLIFLLPVLKLKFTPKKFAHVIFTLFYFVLSKKCTMINLSPNTRKYLLFGWLKESRKGKWP